MSSSLLPRSPGSTLQEEIRGSAGVARSGHNVKFWPPSVEDGRPCKCGRCGVAAYHGSRVVIHGHGLVSHQQRGPAEVDADASCVESFGRRYLCTACKTVMRVQPTSSVARKHFSGPPDQRLRDRRTIDFDPTAQ